uniref:Secreted protein n=2 Tax=Lutzomyia longipalpis TaxID=7200 RepID=A0A1B0EXD9_LUTLO
MLKVISVCFVAFLCVDLALCGPLVGRSGGSKATSGRRNYIGPQDGAPKMLAPKKAGMSSWGVISLIMFAILIGFGGYYGYICYPFMCKKERHYDVMDAASSSTSASTPTTRSAEFEKMDPEFDGSNVFRYK